jgi:hypothetical protein
MIPTPEQKAVELYNSYFDLGRDFTRGVSMKEFSKLCALLAVDEILKAVNNPDETYLMKPSVNYWTEVKAEIEKL